MSLEKNIYKELRKTLKALSLDNLGRCEVCAKIEEKREGDIGRYK